MKRLLAFLFSSRWRGAAALVEVQKLRDLCAAVYQVCGALDAPADVLDALSDASAGSYTGDPLSLLPCPLSEAWLFKNKEAHASVMRGPEQAQRGEFVDPPDLDEGERPAAMIPTTTDTTQLAHAIAANAIVVLWAVVVSYLMGKYSQ